ncbi:hypothetical protein POM88_019136 [Heracleum sosnowskyi]|uniref:DUF4283 domain-containing protein n=1 Tax=Heracleum sosnowskyi TaxID=360622 RepID=A0AAD8ITW1_9APIA|nr:hypothetical protein POM88_019136 [Heracleum sosnowskyi]
MDGRQRSEMLEAARRLKADKASSDSKNADTVDDGEGDENKNDLIMEDSIDQKHVQKLGKIVWNGISLKEGLRFILWSTMLKEHGGNRGLKEVIMNDEGFFFFKFDGEEDLLEVLEDEVCMIEGKPLIMQRWEATGRLSFAKLLIEVDANKPLPDRLYVLIPNEDVEVAAQEKKLKEVVEGKKDKQEKEEFNVVQRKDAAYGTEKKGFRGETSGVQKVSGDKNLNGILQGNKFGVLASGNLLDNLEAISTKVDVKEVVKVSRNWEQDNG